MLKSLNFFDSTFVKVCLKTDNVKKITKITHIKTSQKTGRGTKSTGIKSTRERNQPRNEVNPGIKSTQEENQPEHKINQGEKMHIFKKYFTFYRLFSVLLGYLPPHLKVLVFCWLKRWRRVLEGS